LGGVFFRSKYPNSTGLWYEKYFGINSLQSNDLWYQEAGPTVFAPFDVETEYFGRKDQIYMLNFRVNNLDLFLEYLQKEVIKIDDERQNETIGKFACVYDPEVN
jgi:hypothetical protein